MTAKSLHRLEVREDLDVVAARRRSRQAAERLGLDPQGQARFATAVSEIACNALNHAGGGTVEFLAESAPDPSLLVRVTDRGPGISNLEARLAGSLPGPDGQGLGLRDAQLLVDRFEVETSAAGTTVLLSKVLAGPVSASSLGQLAEALDQPAPADSVEEVERQNRELRQVLQELQARQVEVERLNRELDETNRGVLALYAELDEKAEHLRRASELKSQFLSNMTHEFRTPLNSIQSLTSILLNQSDDPLTEDQATQLDLILHSAEDLSELVNDLLDLAKIEAGKVAVHPSDFEVSELFAALRGMFRPLVAGSEVALTFTEPERLPALFTDEAKVAQVLRNLISNALKFTERGEVRIWATTEPGEVIAFHVSDTGIGIAAPDRLRIFEEFIQIEQRLQGHVKGTGLGLPLSRRLAELIGGSLTVQSIEGKGSTFTAAIPRLYLRPVETEPIPELRRRVPDPDRTPILVVEDDPETLYAYERYLAKSNFQVIPARTIQDARRALRESKPQAVLLDVVLDDGETTWGFLSEMKKRAETRDIPVLVVTVVDCQQTALALGANEFRLKPIEHRWLLNRLGELRPGQPSETILIIDDDPVARRLVRGLLSDTHYQVIEASGGRQGLERARRDRPQVIILDLIMPDMTGFEVLEALKSDPATREIPVIINSSKELEETEQRRLAAGTAAILTKDDPSREVTIAWIREAIAKAGLSHPSPGRDQD